jgi:uncharacterized membrane protein
MTEKGTSDSRLPESARVEAFSDGVFAIALTLLVLDLHEPATRGHFGHDLLEQWPAYVAYLAAFLNISAIWINHHDLFSRVRRVDPPLICANLLLLLVSSLFPWPAAVMSAAVRSGNHSDQVAATVLYAAVGMLVPVTWLLLYAYLAKAPALFVDATGPRFVRKAMRRSYVSIVLYPVAIVLAFIEPIAAIVAFVALPAYFLGTVVVNSVNGRTPLPAAEGQDQL